MTSLHLALFYFTDWFFMDFTYFFQLSVWLPCSCSLSSDPSLSDSLPDPVSTLGWGYYHTAAGTICVASPCILWGEPGTVVVAVGGGLRKWATPVAEQKVTLESLNLAMRKMERIPLREKSAGDKTGEKRRVRSSAGCRRGQKIAKEFAFFIIVV